MNRSGKITVCFIGGLVLTAGVRAGDTVAPGDPYATVVERNIFGLNPPPPPDAHPPDANPPPKITPNGIMSILGVWQVLFKAAAVPKPGSPPPPDQTYILSEGQRQDDIEVVKIDEKNSIVTFNNHGETQALPLVTTMPTSTPSGGPEVPAGGRPVGPGGRFSPGFVNPGAGNPNGNFGGGKRGNGNSAGNGGNNSGGVGSGLNFGNPSAQNATFVQHPSMDPATQTIMIEANRLQAQQSGDPSAKLYPITVLTPPPADSGDPTLPPE